MAALVFFGVNVLFSSHANGSSKILVKDYVWLRKVTYRDSTFYIIKNDPRRRVVFFKNGKRIFHKASGVGSFSIDFDGSSAGVENRFFAKKNGLVLKVGIIKKPLVKYFESGVSACKVSKIPFVLDYQVRNFSSIQSASDGVSNAWENSNCESLLSAKYSDVILDRLQDGFKRSQDLAESCFSSKDMREQFLNDSASLDFAFNFISGFENAISSLGKNTESSLVLNCEAQPAKSGEKASLDKTVKPMVLNLNVYDILNSSSADQNLSEVVNSISWSAFHELGHGAMSLPLIPVNGKNCFDEGVISAVADFCKSFDKNRNWELQKVVNNCLLSGAANSSSLSPEYAKDAVRNARGGDLIPSRPGASKEVFLVASSEQAAQTIAQNSNAAMFAAAPTTALDTLANETLVTTSGSLASGRERQIIATPQYEEALERTYRYFDGVSNTTSNLVAQALLPQAQAATAQTGSAAAVQVGKNIATSGAASKLPANVQIYQPAQYIADLTCPSENCSPSPALVAAYSVKSASSNPGSSSINETSASLASTGSSAQRAQGKIQDSGIQTSGSVGAVTQGKLDSSATTGPEVKAASNTATSVNGGSAPAPTRSVAAVGGSQTVRAGAVNRGDSEALQILASADERLGGKYLQQVRSKYTDPKFPQQLANRGWSIEVYEGSVLKRKLGATTDIQMQFIDNGKELVRKKSGK